MNTSVNSISINGTEYVPKGSNAQNITSPVRIVILQRGWVMIGRYERNGDDCKLLSASVIRNWGTTKGLGELALEGPKKDTKLDPTNGVVEFHRLTEIATIQANEAVWAQHLK